MYWVPSFDSHESITFSDPVMRFSHHLSEYSQSTFYAVRRTDFLKMIYAENIKFTFNGLLIELFLSMLTLIYGKLKFLDVLYAARDSGSTPVTGYRPTLKDTIESGTYDKEYAKFRECLSVHLSKQSHLSIKESTKLVDEAMAAYLKKSGIPKRRIEFESKMRPVLDSLNLPDWVNREGKRLYAGVTGLRQDKKHPVETPVLPLSRKDFIKMTVSSKDYDDFERIRVHVLSSSEKNANLT